MIALKIFGWSVFGLWAVSTGYEFYDREPGETISIVGQMFLNAGIPYFVFFLILLWFIKKTGLDRLPMVLDILERRYGSAAEVTNRRDEEDA